MLKLNYPEINSAGRNRRAVLEKVHIALGSNMGNRLQNLSKAIELLETDESTIIKGISNVYLSSNQSSRF